MFGAQFRRRVFILGVTAPAPVPPRIETVLLWMGVVYCVYRLSA